ncbi:hypothetical protein IV55_GL001509 [Furfurilactobacillus siliginis]|uniref:Uncharacterized protein n=1 Tax=Furfurilactobacillus siliginis TaxID=348151 RepID=A0A0R2L3D1_9LACO|nr:hypothetical protein IV55_GL001509 [Furfurilactobacillus siliginis]
MSLNQQQPLMYVKLGSSDKSRVYLISKGQHTDPEHGTVTLQHTTQQRPTVIIKKETMTYRTGWQKFWFGWSRNDRQLRHVYYTFKLPRGYALKQVKR